MVSTSNTESSTTEHSLNVNTTLEEASKPKVTINKEEWDNAQVGLRLKDLFYKLKSDNIELIKLVNEQKQEINKLSASLVKVGRRNDEVETQLDTKEKEKIIKVGLDCTELSAWSMSNHDLPRDILATVDLEKKKIIDYERY